MKAEMTHIFTELYPLIAALVGMILSQFIKLIIVYLSEGSLEPKTISRSGGMPSAHSALVAALTTAIGLQEGWTSSLFCICVVLSLVILYDAAGVRQAAGKQAVILNEIIADLVEKGQFRSVRLTELLGHTPLEVIVGTLLGIGVAFTLFY